MTGSALGAILLSGFAPRRVAIAHRDTSLLRAYGIHWLALIFGTALLLVVLALERSTGPELVALWSDGELFSTVAVIVYAVVIATVEAAFVLSALVLLPWGEATARVGLLWRQALRTVWLHASHLGLVACLFASIAVCCENYLEPLSRREWAFESDRQTDSILLQWVADNYTYAFPAIIAAFIVWYLWALLRAMTTRLALPGPARHPLCEVCGYNLSHHDLSARCPECGRAVAESLDPKARAPVRWSRFHRGGPRTGFARASINAWLRPERFFMRVPATTGLRHAGAFLLCHLILTAAALLAGYGVPGVLLYPANFVDALDDDEIWLAVSILVWGSVCLGSAFALLTCLVATTVGLVFSRQDGRNQTAGCLRVACFCAGVFPFSCFVLTAGTFVAVYVVDEMGLAGHPYQPVVMIGVMGLIAAMIVFYIGAVVRRMQYMRYANS